MNTSSRRIVIVALVVSACAALVSAGAHIARAEQQKPGATVQSLLAKDLAGLPGREGVMFTVEYPPGGTSTAHRHDAHVFVYVLSGAIRMQVDGGEPLTLEPGDTFYESPDNVHRISANASDTEPARFLVVMIKDKGKPATRPVEQAP
jgi:quercetin dioxygenase-like cupin family protein